MVFAQVILVASALPFLLIGGAFLVCPQAMASLVGLTFENATADADVRAVYGGLQLGCGLVLGLAARTPEWLRFGLVVQLALYGGLAAARFLSYAAVGWPSLLGFALHGGEIVAFAAGLLAWHRGKR